MFGRIVEAIVRNDREPRIFDHAVQTMSAVRVSMAKYLRFRFDFLGTLETDDQRNGHAQLFRGANNALRDIIAAHDT